METPWVKIKDIYGYGLMDTILLLPLKQGKSLGCVLILIKKTFIYETPAYAGVTETDGVNVIPAQAGIPSNRK